jgi:hypothetical protein
VAHPQYYDCLARMGNYASGDGTHPNATGHAAIGAELASLRCFTDSGGPGPGGGGDGGDSSAESVGVKFKMIDTAGHHFDQE